VGEGKGEGYHRSNAYQNWLASHKPFHWFIEFYGIMKAGGFDVIIGNPPYVELTKITAQYRPQKFVTEPCGNLYALCIERSFILLRDDSRFGFIVQQPLTSTIRMELCRRTILDGAGFVWSSTFDDRPAKLFDGMHHARLAIILSNRKYEPVQTNRLFVTLYNKWFKEEREMLFQRLHYVNVVSETAHGVFPKIASTTEVHIVDKLLQVTSKLDSWISKVETPNKLYYKITGVGSWFTITPRPPRFFRDHKESSSTREATISFPSAGSRDLAFCLLNSSLFYWFYQVRTNCRDFNPSDYKTFPVVVSLIGTSTSGFAPQLRTSLDASAEVITVSHSLTGAIAYEQFHPRVAKPIIDEIDCVLAKHYGFTDEELDFIINYDIKYRMGRDIKDDE